MTYTFIIVAVTVLVSLAAFNSSSLYNNLILWPKYMHKNPAEYHRFLSHGFIHADYMHLFFNMFALYIFGKEVETLFGMMGQHKMFLVLYLAGIVVAAIPSFWKNRNNSYYRSLGASGGVAAVLFSFSYFAPWQIIRVWFIPIPSIIASVAYLVYSAYMSKRGSDNVNHDAHFWGAVFGFVFTFIIDPSHGQIFLQMITHPQF